MSELQATKLEAYVFRGYYDTFDGGIEIVESKGHRYDVTDGIDEINIMEWDSVANGTNWSSHIKSNENCGPFKNADVLAAVRAAY